MLIMQFVSVSVLRLVTFSKALLDILVTVEGKTTSVAVLAAGHLMTVVFSLS